MAHFKKSRQREGNDERKSLHFLKSQIVTRKIIIFSNQKLDPDSTSRQSHHHHHLTRAACILCGIIQDFNFL